MKKTIMLLLIGITFSLMLFGCASNSADVVSELETESVAESAPEPEIEPLVIEEVESEEESSEISYLKIGEEGDQALKVQLTNTVGQEIIGIAVKSSEEDSYSENLVPEGVSILAGEIFELYYTPVEGEVADDAELDTDVAMLVTYDIRLTCAGDTEFILYDFGFSDITAAVLGFEDEVAFVKYISNSTGDLVNTKEAQLAVKKKLEEETETAKKASNNKKAKTTTPPQDEGDCNNVDIDWVD